MHCRVAVAFTGRAVTGERRFVRLVVDSGTGVAT